MKKIKNQSIIYFAIVITIIISYMFNKPLTGEFVFSGIDSLSPSAINQGINSSCQTNGEYPLWLPWIFSGLPSLHSLQNISDYYFINYIKNFIVYLGFSSFWNYIIHFILAGVGTFILLRQIGVDKYAASFGGLAFSLMPYLITMVVHGHGSQMMTVVWIPWVLWAINKIYIHSSIYHIGLLGLIVGLQMQRAHVQIAYYTWMASGLLVLMLLLGFSNNLNKRYNWFIYICLGFVLGICMAMWIYLPVFNYTPFSIRGASIGGGAGFDYSTAWSFSIREISTFFIPSFYGFGGPTYWGNMPFTDYPNYMGILVLTFGGIGVVFSERKIKWYFIFLGLISILLALGKKFFLYGIFYEYFPFFNKFRVPVMFLVMLQFSFSILSGLGIEVITNKLIEAKENYSLKEIYYSILIVFCIVIGLKILFGLTLDFGHRSHPVLDILRKEIVNNDFIRIIAILISVAISIHFYSKNKISKEILLNSFIALSIFDMVWVDKQIIEPDNNSYRKSTLSSKNLYSSYLEPDEIIRFLKNDTTKFRILPLGILRNDNRWSAFEIESIDGYHPAKLHNYNQIIENVGWNSLGLLQMLNVKYVISTENFSHPAFKKVFSGMIFHNGGYLEAVIYKYKNYLPRLFFVEKLEKIENLKNQYTRLKDQNFNPITMSFINKLQTDTLFNTNAIAEIIHWSPNKIEIEVKSDAKQFLVISEIYYPYGWEVTSHPNLKIVEVNSILRGISIPKGDHKIIMEFIPKDVLMGSIITWTSFSIIIFLLLFGFFKNKNFEVRL